MFTSRAVFVLTNSCIDKIEVKQSDNFLKCVFRKSNLSKPKYLLYLFSPPK